MRQTLLVLKHIHDRDMAGLMTFDLNDFKVVESTGEILLLLNQKSPERILTCMMVERRQLAPELS